GTGAVAAAPAAALQASENEAVADLKDKGVATVATKTVGDKTFYKRGKTWVDADAETPEAERAPVATVKSGTPEYFELLKKAPELARWFALGDDVTVFWRGTLCKVVSGN